MKNKYNLINAKLILADTQILIDTIKDKSKTKTNKQIDKQSEYRITDSVIDELENYIVALKYYIASLLDES